MNLSLLLSEVFSFPEVLCYIVYQRIKIKNTDLQTIMIKYSLHDRLIIRGDHPDYMFMVHRLY